MTRSALPFPHDPVTFNEDGTVPASLIISIPATRPRASVSKSGEVVSKEMFDLVQGLLDVRIPERLGSMDRFDEFPQHFCFTQSKCNPSHLCVSPLLEEDCGEALSGQHHRRPFEPSSEDPLPRGFDQSIETELDKLFYVRECHKADQKDRELLSLKDIFFQFDCLDSAL